MAPRLNKAQSELLEKFGFEISTPPERDNTRRSKYDETWEAAKGLLESMPGVQIKVRTYTNASAAYADAKAINNGEHRHFKNEGEKWLAIGTKTEDETWTDNDGNEQPLYAVWLTYKG